MNCLVPGVQAGAWAASTADIFGGSARSRSVRASARPRLTMHKKLDGAMHPEKGAAMMATSPTRSSWRTCAKIDPTHVATVVLPIRVGWVVVMDHKPGRR